MEDGELPAEDKLARKTVLEADQYCIDGETLYHLAVQKFKELRKEEPFIKKIAVPKNLRAQILQAYHDECNHDGIERCYAHIGTKYYWTNMYADTKAYCKSCTICQQHKRHHNVKPAPLNPLPITNLHSQIHIDYCGPLVESVYQSQKVKYILLVVDSYSKFPMAFATQTMEAAERAEILYNNVFTMWGAPAVLLSDRGANFLSKLIAELCKLFEIKKVNTSSYRPQTNSTCENMNRTIWASLRCDLDGKGNWPDYLQSVMAAIRATPSVSSSGFSPYKISHGQEMNWPISGQIQRQETTGNLTLDEYIDKMISRIELMRKVVTDNIQETQKGYKHQYDKRTTLRTFRIGESLGE